MEFAITGKQCVDACRGTLTTKTVTWHSPDASGERTSPLWVLPTESSLGHRKTEMQLCMSFKLQPLSALHALSGFAARINTLQVASSATGAYWLERNRRAVTVQPSDTQHLLVAQSADQQ